MLFSLSHNHAIPTILTALYASLFPTIHMLINKFTTSIQATLFHSINLIPHSQPLKNNNLIYSSLHDNLITFNILNKIQYMLTSYTQFNNLLPLIKPSKNGHKQKMFQIAKFTDSIKTAIRGGQIYQPKNSKEYELGIAIFIAVILYKAQKLKKKPQILDQFLKVIDKCKKSNDLGYQKFIQIIKKCLQNSQDLANIHLLIPLKQTLSICQLICQKNKTFFSFSNNEKEMVANFQHQFDSQIFYMQYQPNLQRFKYKVQHSDVSVIKIDKQYLILYQSYPTIKITEQKKLQNNRINAMFQQKQNPPKQIITDQKDINNSTKQLIKIYTHSSNDSQQDQLKSTTNSTKQLQSKQHRQISRETSPQHKVVCTKCSSQFQQSYCLYWNYIYLCIYCVTDIKNDTSDIHRPRLQAFLRKHKFEQFEYNLDCPLCHKTCKISNYQPAKKCKKYTCNQCRQMVCVKHNKNIKNCYCYCIHCKVPTMYLQKLQINYCLTCRYRFCFQCKQHGTIFCKCICQNCLTKKSKQHQCQSICQFCKNKANQRKLCQKCSAMICYGCYYGQPQNTQVCHQIQYI